MFLRDDDGRVYRTYFVTARGAEPFTPTWAILDVTPFGRQEEWEDSPAGRPQSPPYEWGGCTTSTGAADAVSRRGPGAARR